MGNAFDFELTVIPLWINIKSAIFNFQVFS